MWLLHMHTRRWRRWNYLSWSPNSERVGSFQIKVLVCLFVCSCRCWYGYNWKRAESCLLQILHWGDIGNSYNPTFKKLHYPFNAAIGWGEFNYNIVEHREEQKKYICISCSAWTEPASSMLCSSVYFHGQVWSGNLSQRRQDRSEVLTHNDGNSNIWAPTAGEGRGRGKGRVEGMWSEHKLRKRTGILSRSANAKNHVCSPFQTPCWLKQQAASQPWQHSAALAQTHTNAHFIRQKRWL